MPKDGGWVILNSDNDYCWRIGLAVKEKKQVIFYGTSEKAQFRASNIKISRQGTDFDLSLSPSSLTPAVKEALQLESERKKYHIHLKTVGKHQVYSALVALAVGSIYKIGLQSMIKSLAEFSPPPSRDYLIFGLNGSLIIDSTYNANLTSMKAALETLKSLKTRGRKIAVLGDMLELGHFSEQAHREVAERAKKIANKIVLVGPQFQKVKTQKWFADSRQAADFLSDKIKKHDIILVKGSHAIMMGVVVKKLSESNSNNHPNKS